MPTKEQVKKRIEEIKDKGQNTAQTVRSVLNEIVDYATPQESGGDSSQLQTFSYQGTSALKRELAFRAGVETVCSLTYSVRGIKELFANITFALYFPSDLITEDTVSPELKVSFPIEENKQMFNDLSKIIYKTNDLENPTFLLSVTNIEAEKDKKYSGNYPTNFRLVNFKLDLDLESHFTFTFRIYAEYSILFQKGDYASTSFAIHVPNTGDK